MDSVVKDNIQLAISSLGGLNSDKSKIKDVDLHDDDYSLSLSNLHRSRIKSEFIPSNDEYNELLKTSSFSGAGGILYSSFSYTGWKFPNLAITESDEKVLFDVEVKLKLGHPGCEVHLWAIVADFPPHIIIRRTGIIQQLLDIVGSVFFHDTDMVLAAGITPSSAMKWLEKLLKKSIDGYLIQMDGSSSSAIPEPWSADDNEKSDVSPSLASQMAKAIYSMRIPVHTNPDNINEIAVEAGALSYEQRKIQNLGTVKPPLPPTPSLSGFAFSCCAACLPIFQTKDLSLCTSVLSILLSALPYIKDPNLDGELTGVDCNRIQHLMSRVEQMIKYFGNSLSFRYSFQHEDGIMITDEMEKASFEALFVRVIIEIISLIPLDNISNSGVPRESNTKIIIGPNTVEVIKKIITFTLNDPFPDMKLFTNVDVLLKALSMVDASSFTQIKYTNSILSTHSNMNANLEELIRIRQDGYSDYNVKQDREIKVVEDLVKDAMNVCCLLDDDLLLGLNISGLGLIKIIFIIIVVSYDSCFANYAFDAMMPVILRLVSCGNSKAKFELIDILGHYLNDQKLSSVGIFAEIENLLSALGLGSNDSDAAFVKNTIKQALSNENFVYSVLMYGILNNIDKKDAQSKQGIDGSVLILNLLFQHMLQSSPRPKLINWCNSLCPLKLIQWKVEMGCGLGSNIMEGYVQELPSAISTFIELLEDTCAAADPNANSFPNANEQYNKALLLGLFSISPTIRNRCCLTLQGLGLGLNTQNYRLISSLNTNSPFPNFGEINPSVPDTQEVAHKSTSSFSNFKFTDLKKLGDIAFGTENIVSTIAFLKNSSTSQSTNSKNKASPISVDFSIRISALRQMQEILTENLLVSQNKITKTNTGTPNLTVSLTLEYDWCVALLSLTLVLIRDLRLRLDCTGNDAANKNSDLVTLSMEASNMIRLLTLTIPSLKRKIRLSLIEENELGVGLGLGLSVHPLLSLLTNPNPNPNQNPSDIEVKAWTKLQLTLAHLLYLLITDSEGWKFDSNTPNDYQQIFIATQNPTSSLFTVPSFLLAFMNDIENVNASLNCGTNPNPTYGFISCICKSNKNSSICRDVVESALDGSPSLSLDTLTNIIFSIQDKLNEISPQNYDNSKYRSCLNLLNSITITLPLTLTLTPGLLINNSMSMILGSILNKAPKDHEDFLTLNLVLEYVSNCLSAIYAGLSLNNGQMVSEERSFIYDIVHIFNNPLGSNPLLGILTDPSPATYFKSHLYHNPGSNPNKSTMTLPLTQSDIINMQNIFNQSQCLILEILKSVTSICVAVKGDNDDTNLRIEFDYGLISTLVRVLSIENFSSNLRNLAASCVEGVLIYKGSWDIDNREGLGVGFGLEFEFNIFDSARNVNNNTSKSSIDVMLRVVKLLRVPDSLIGSGIVTIALRILSLYLKSVLASGEGLGLGLDWKWLVKLCYDRRAEVRALCLELIDLILTIEKTIDNRRFGLQDTAPLTNEETDDNINWPPHDTLKLIVLDKNEAGSVRVMAAKVLVKHSTTSQSAGLVGQIVMSLYDTLDLSSPRANVSSIRESLGIIALLLSSMATAAETLKCLISMKVLPQIISILNPNFPTLMQQLAKSRVSLKHSNSKLLNYGWGLLWREYLKENEQNLVLCFASVAKIIVLLSKISIDSNNNYFTQCVTLTPVIPNAILAMSNLTNSLSGDYASFSYAYSSLADLVTQAISLQINDKNKVLHLEKSNSQSSTVILIESIAYQLELAGALIQEAIDLGIEVIQSSAFLITSTTRLLSHVLSIKFWENALDIKDGHRSMKSVLLSALITLKSFLSALLPSVTSTRLTLQVDVTISLLLQKSNSSEASVIDEDNNESFYSDLVISNIKKINDCCEIISNAGQTNNSIHEMKSSLKTLRKKMGRDKGDTYRSKVRGYSNNQSGDPLNANKSFIISDSNRLILWQSLLILTNALADSPKLRHLASEFDVAFTLSKLFRYCPYWAAAPGSASHLHDTHWYPTNCSLSSATLALALAFCHHSDINKNILATTGELALSIASHNNRLKATTESARGKVIHQLLSMGLSKGLILPFRCLSLELLGVTVSSIQPNPVLQKMCLSSTLIAALRKSLHSSTSDPDILVFLLDAFTSIITSKNTKEIHSSTNIIKENLEDIELNMHRSDMSIPALLQWIWDVSTNYSPTLAASLLRCVGRMGNPLTNVSPPSPNYNGSEALYKRLLSNVTDEDTLTIVTTACNSNNIILQEVGLMALWSILHNSEQARAHFKKSGLNLNSSNSNTRSRVALNLLMN